MQLEIKKYAIIRLALALYLSDANSKESTIKRIPAVSDETITVVPKEPRLSPKEIL